MAEKRFFHIQVLRYILKLLNFSLPNFDDMIKMILKNRMAKSFFLFLLHKKFHCVISFTYIF